MVRTRLTKLLPALSAIAMVFACSDPTPVDTPNAVAPQSAVGTAPGLNAQLVPLRQVTARFQNFDAAVAAGYGEQITVCWAHHSKGAMGYHYAKTSLLDGNVALTEPEVVMYEPQPGGHMKLVGMEYIVPLAAWQGTSPPTLLGQPFTQHSTLPIYKLHIWLWRNNPDGIFADWNPKVSCESAADTEVFN